MDTSTTQLQSRQFPVLGAQPAASVPWAWLQQFEVYAVQNHDQTLERLAARGGLCWGEILAIVRYQSLLWAFHYCQCPVEEIRAYVLAEVAKWAPPPQ